MLVRFLGHIHDEHTAASRHFSPTFVLALADSEGQSYDLHPTKEYCTGFGRIRELLENCLGLFFGSLASLPGGALFYF